MDSIVMVFGVFDFLHAGHVYFLDQVKQMGNTVVVSLANDDYVTKYKNKNVNNNFEKRENLILEKYPEFIVVPSDDEIGKWSVVLKYKPNIIALGYDQENLGNALIQSSVLNDNTKIVYIDSYFPEKYKTSLL